MILCDPSNAVAKNEPSTMSISLSALSAIPTEQDIPSCSALERT